LKNTFLPKLALFGVLLIGGKLFAQTAPAITYPTPQVFVTGKPAALSPTNTGGTITPAVYNTVSTFVGTAGTTGHADGTGTAATFNGPQNMVADAIGNIYVADFDNNNIRKITPAGVVTIFAGSSVGTPGYSNTGAGLFDGPNGITIDATGTLYISDKNNNQIRKVTSAGVVSTLSTSALRGPAGLCFDALGTTLYVAEQTGNHIRKVAKSTGVVSNWSGSTSSASGFTNGNLANTRYNAPVDVAFDASSNLYVMDAGNHAIRKVATSGTSTTFVGAGTGTTALSGYTNANTTAARFNGPYGMAMDLAGNMYVGDYNNNVIRKITTAGVVTTFAGPASPTTTAGTTDGPIATASFNGPRDILITTTGIMYVSDFKSHTIRKIALSGYTISPALPAGLSFDSATGIISGTPTTETAATNYTITAYNYYGSSAQIISLATPAVPLLGNYPASPYVFPVSKAITALPNTNSGGAVPSTVYGTVSSPASGLSGPTGVTVTINGTIFFADKGNNRIKKISAGTVSTIAGAAGTGVTDAAGTSARFSSPSDVTTDGAGNLYVADLSNNRIRKIVIATNAVTTFAGNTGNPASSLGYADGSGTAAKFSAPSGLTYDASTGNIYVADQGNHAIRKITPAGVVSKFAGTGSAGSVDATGTSASFSSPAAVATDAAGNIYVADKGNHKIRKITPAGVVTTFAGNGTAGSVDGISTVAQFNAPNGITVDQSGNVYVSDGGTATSNKIRRITPGGVVSTVAGTGAAGSTDAAPATAKFNIPAGLSIDPTTGNILVADGGSNKIRQIIGTGYTVSPTLPAGLTLNTSGTISGTPTGVSTAKDYTVTAFNLAGSSSTTINIATEYTEPDISYTTPVSFLMGTALGTTTNPTPVLTNNGSAVLSTVHTSTALTATGLSRPFGMARDASGNIYVTNYTANTISKYSSTGAYIGAMSTTTAFISPTAIAFDSGGNCYVLNYNGGAGVVYKYNASGAQISSNYIPGTGLKKTYGMAIDASDNLYITNFGGNGANAFSQILKYTTAATPVLTATLTSTNLDDPTGIIADAAGNLYITNLGANNVVKYILATTSFSPTPFATGMDGPYGINIDALGNIYVGDTGNGLVKIYNSGGTLITSITNSNPRGLVIDGQFNVFVSNYAATGTLTKWARTGGYFADKPLPAGLVLSNTTGAISGTPTASTPATDYTITAYNTQGGGSTVINITVYQLKKWLGSVGALATDWTAAGNWTGGAPTTADRAVFTNNYLSLPTITTPTSVGSIVLGSQLGSFLKTIVTVNSTLTVSGDIIYQSDAQSVNNNTGTITGSGKVIATNLNVIANTTSGTAGHPYTVTLASNIDSLILTGNITLTSNKPAADVQNAKLNVTGGTVKVAGDLTTTNANGSTSTISVTGGTLAIGGTIQSNNNTSGITAITVSNATLKLSDPDPLAELTANANDANTLALNAGSTVEYAGADQTVYSDAALVGQPAGLSYKNIAFSGSGIKDVASGNLTVSGDLTDKLTSDNTTNYVDFSESAVSFNGTNQALKTGDGLGTTLYNTSFSGGTKTMSSSGTGVFSLASSGVFTLSGSSTLASGGVLTLKSDASGTATVATIPSGSSITGNVIAQRFITGNQDLTYRGYRLLSSPVGVPITASTTSYYSLSYLYNSGTYITGAADGVGAGGFDAPGTAALYMYREDKAPSSVFLSGNYRPITKLNNTPNPYHIGVGVDGDFDLPVGNGILFFFRGNMGTLTTTPPNDVTLKMSGTLNQGQVVVKNWVTQSTNLLYTTPVGDANIAVRGFNLVGNPYPSSIDWDKFSFSATATSPIYAPNIDGFIYSVDPISKNYAVYQAGLPDGIGTHGATNIIPAGQGFFVRALGTTQLIFNESAKVNDQVSGGNLLMGTPVNTTASKQYIRLQLVKDAVNTDDIIIRFNPAANSNFVNGEDAPYQKGNGVLSLASISTNNTPLAINQLPLLKQTQVIPLKIAVNSNGIYQLNINDIKGLPEIYDVWLKDAYKKDSLDVKHNTTYAFNVLLSDTSSYGNKRFSLVIRQNPGYAYRLLDFNGHKDSQQIQLAWKTENEANYTYFTLERSTDGGKHFEVLASVPATGIGNYSFIDKFPVKDENQYRLKQEDMNGVISYSKIVSIMYTFASNSIEDEIVSVYPNPASSSINVVINKAIGAAGAYHITITNSMGGVIKSAVSSQPDWKGDVSRLLPGTYFIQVINEKDKSKVGQSSFIKL
jgi:sugar lactone lactonase YvrE